MTATDFAATDVYAGTTVRWVRCRKPGLRDWEGLMEVADTQEYSWACPRCRVLFHDKVPAKQ